MKEFIFKVQMIGKNKLFFRKFSQSLISQMKKKKENNKKKNV